MSMITNQPNARAVANPPWAAPICTASDPLGQHPAPGSNASFAESLAKLLDERIQHQWRGRATDKLSGVPDAELVMELLARGWAVFKPKINDAAE